MVSQPAVGLPLNIFITITLESQSEAALQAFEQEIAAMPEVMECYLMTGAADYLIRIVARDVDDLERIHSTRLTRLAGVSRVTSSIAMRQVVRRAELPHRAPRGSQGQDTRSGILSSTSSDMVRRHPHRTRAEGGGLVERRAAVLVLQVELRVAVRAGCRRGDGRSNFLTIHAPRSRPGWSLGSGTRPPS